MRTLIHRAAALSSLLVGSARAFVIACVIIAGLIGLGGLFGYSDRWLAIFSAALSAVTFLLVFLLQYRESRHTDAIQLKLNELLRAVEGAREHEFLDLEYLAEEELERRSSQLRDQSVAAREESQGPP